MFAKYTVHLKTLMDNQDAKQKLDQALSTYPLYEGKKGYDGIPTREQLNKRLLNWYKYREIGFETVGRFLDELEITMCEIMPYYNERLKTIEIMADLPNPFDNVDVIEEYSEERSSESSGTNNTKTNTSATNKTESASISTMNNEVNSTNETDDKKVHSATPQDSISVPANNIDGVEYADDVEWNKHNGKDNSTSEGSSSESGSADSESSSEGESISNGESSENSSVHHTFTKKGNQGVNTYAHDMNEFRTAIIDVVNEIINDKRVADLFMVIY